MCTTDIPLERLHQRTIRLGVKHPKPKQMIGVCTYELDDALGEVLRVDVTGEDFSFLFQERCWQGSIRPGCSADFDFEIDL